MELMRAQDLTSVLNWSGQTQCLEQGRRQGGDGGEWAAAKVSHKGQTWLPIRIHPLQAPCRKHQVLAKTVT